jgi:glycosyltransferase involved in cell wall biosynthesis
MSDAAAATPRLRVAVLSRNFGARFGGAERYSVELVRELSATHEMHVFAQAFDHDLTGIQIHRVPRGFTRPRWLNQWWFAAWTAWATRRGFDVVHSHENTWHGDVQSIHVRPFRFSVMQGHKGAARLLRGLSVVLSPRLAAYWLLEALRLRGTGGRRIVASSNAVRDEAVAAYPHAAVATCVIEPGVRLPDPSRNVDHRTARAQLGLPDALAHAPLALFVGNDPLKKGLPALLDAIAQVSGLHLLVVSPDAGLAPFRAQAQRLGVADRVHFAGALSDITQAYAAADWLVHPTTEDTYAMVVLEAMAWGLPVVVSSARHCGIAADLRDGADALVLTDPRDSAQIAQAITRLMNDTPLRERLRDAGRAFAAARTWPLRAAALEALYLRVAAAKPEAR